MTYEELVKKVAVNWDNDHKNLNGPDMEWHPKYPDLIWNWDRIRELNLWNYWQGSKTHKADIMLVGQDWGNPQTMGGDILYESIVNGRNYFDGQKIMFDTDRNLAELFGVLEKGGKQLFPDIIQNQYDNLYFTNFCLGYRKNNNSGGLSKSFMKSDAQYFFDLVKIIDPKIVIVLGKMTYECAVSALKGTAFSADNFLKNLCNGVINQYRTIINGHESAVVGVAHCGSYGVNINRLRYESNETNGLNLMKKDWKRINTIISELI